MKQYDFIHLNIDYILGAGSEEHRKIITDCAAAGWRYVGYVPTNITGHGKVTDIDLIFEKDADPYHIIKEYFL